MPLCQYVTLQRFVRYVQRQYLGRQERRDMLNAFDTPLGHPRTSNCAEGFHSALYECIRMHGSGMILPPFHL